MAVDTQEQSDARAGSNPSVPATTAGALPKSLLAVVALARAVRNGAPDPKATYLFDDRLDWIEIITLADQCRFLPLLISGIRIQDPTLLGKSDLAALDDYLTFHGARCDILVEAHAGTLARLTEASVRAVTYKGPALAKVVYGNFQARDFRDFDVLVAQSDFETAIEALRKIGFRIDERMEAECHLIAQTDQFPLVVDLHNRLADIYLPIPPDIDRLWDHLQTIELGGHRLLTFTPEGHLFVCCLHLVKEWHNQKPFFQYALDVAVLLADRTPEQWRALLEMSHTLGVEAYVKLSFSVAARLLERACPVTWEKGREDALRLLCERLLADLPCVVETQRPPETKFYSAKSLTVRRTLAPDLRSWLARELWLLRNQLFFIDDYDKEWLRLPTGLHGLYFAVRPIRLMSRYVGRYLHSGR